MSWLAAAMGGFAGGAVAGATGQYNREPAGGSNPPKNWQKTSDVYRATPKQENVATIPATITLDTLPPDHNPGYVPDRPLPQYEPNDPRGWA